MLVNAPPVWDPVDGATGQGTRVQAIVGPGLVKGTTPGNQANFRPYEYSQLFIAVSKGRQYAQGHLLNENLGGPGKPHLPHAAENLTAFPQWPTNTDHKTVVEKDVKDGVDAGKWYRYEVRIGYSTDSMPRLMKRLGLAGAAFDNAWQAKTGLVHTDATYSYASSLAANWEELDPASTNAAPVALPGTNGVSNFAIPNPLSFTKDPAGEYPGYVRGTYEHMETFKAHQTFAKTLGGLHALAGRAHVMPQRWLGIDDARANIPLAVTATPRFTDGYNSYLAGVADSRLGPPAARFGRGYTLGYADFEDGITHAHTNRIGTPPAIHAATTAHAEYWAGKDMALLQLLANPPVGNRAHIAGHADYWAGVDHAKTNLAGVPPVGKLASVDGHNDYWAGVTHALTNTAGQPPTGNHASAGGHKDFWDGVTAAAADLNAPIPPSPLGKAQGQRDYLAGVTHAQANPRAIALPPGNLATTTAFNDYWAGVDHAKTNIRGTPYPTASAAAAEGIKDWWVGVDTARSDLATLEKPGPTAGGQMEGFAAYRDGVEAHKAGQPDQPGGGFSLGWSDCQAGVADGMTFVPGSPAAPKQTHAGFLSGFSYGAGVVLAKAGHGAPVGPDAAAAVAGAGHGAYHTGMQQAGADLASATPVALGAAQGHTGFVAGVNHARAHPRATAPPPGDLATTTAFNDYWAGVDHAKTNIRGTPYPTASAAAEAGRAEYWTGVDHAIANPQTGGPPGGGAAEVEGATDVWAGEDHALTNRIPPPGAVASSAFQDLWAGVAFARHNLPNLTGAAPPGRIAGRGFMSYKQGVLASHQGQPNQPAWPAFFDGWQDYNDGGNARRANNVDPLRWESGYLYGVQQTPQPVVKRARNPGYLGNLGNQPTKEARLF
jgi:hypothetical protein